MTDDYRARLIAARERLLLSPAAMADMLMTPRQTYTQWESGARRTPGIAVACAEMAARLRKSPVDWPAELRRARRMGETGVEAAKRLGVSKSSVYQQIRRHKISLDRGKAGKESIAVDWNRIFAARETGDTGFTIAARLGCSPITVYRHARRLGVKFNVPRGPAPRRPRH